MEGIANRRRHGVSGEFIARERDILSIVKIGAWNHSHGKCLMYSVIK
jgi:hypothetical protein